MTSGMAGEIRGEKEHSGSQDTSIFKEWIVNYSNFAKGQ
jgi:hypothetical protein